MKTLTHLDDAGQARMIAVGDKPESARFAEAHGKISMQRATLDQVRAGTMKKGDVLAVARIAAIGAVKRTSDAIPLCHPLRITGVTIDFALLDDAIAIRATVAAFDRTGVEMEALHAVTIAALTIYDMCKAVEREMRITDVELVAKRGGKSGDWQRKA